jgi:hypothetical protein
MNRFSKNGPLPRKQSPVEPNTVQRKAVDPLLTLYDELNAWWNKAEEDFAAMRVPHVVSHDVSSFIEGGGEVEHVTSLEWNYENRWRILVSERTYYHIREESEVNSETPIAECPMDVRVKMASHLRELREKMKKAKEAYIPEVGEAIAQIKQALAD